MSESIIFKNRDHDSGEKKNSSEGMNIDKPCDRKGKEQERKHNRDNEEQEEQRETDKRRKGHEESKQDADTKTGTDATDLETASSETTDREKPDEEEKRRTGIG